MKKSSLILIFLFTFIYHIFSYKSLLERADTALKNKKYCEAYVYYKAALKVDNALKMKKQFQENFDKSYSFCLYFKGMEHLEKGNLETAYKYFLQSRDLNPSLSEVNEKIAWTKIEISKQICLKGIKILEGESTDTVLIRDALDLFDRSLELDPNNSKAEEYKEIAKNKLGSLKESVDDMFQKGMDLFRSNKVNEATQQFEKVNALHPDFKAVKEKLYDIYLLNAYNFEKDKKWANALVEYLRILKVIGQKSDILEAIRLVYTKLLNKISYPIALSFYDSKARKLLADKTYSLFFEKPSRDLFLLEFEKLEDMIDIRNILTSQKKIQQNKRVPVQENIKELNYLVSLKIENFDIFSPPYRSEQKVHRYILKVEQYFNKKWGQVNRQIQKLKEKHQSELNANKSLAAMGTFLKLTAAEAALNRLEKYHEKVTYGDHTYTSYTYSKIGKIRIKYVLKDIQQSVIIDEGELLEEVISTDTMINDIFPGLDEDPLELLSDFEIKERLTALISKKLLKTVEKGLDKYMGDILFNTAVPHVKSGDVDKAISGFVEFLLVDENRWTEKHKVAAQYINKIKSIPWEFKNIFLLIEEGEAFEIKKGESLNLKQ